MVIKVRHYADGGKVQLPGPETRKMKPLPPMAPPKKGPPPKKMADGGKVEPPKPKPKETPKETAVEKSVTKGALSGGLLGGAANALRDKRAQQMKDLGLKDGGKVKPNMKAPLGQGGRFAAVAAAAKKSGARNPNAVAAAVGRKKYGAKKMAKMAAAGRK